MTNILVYVRPWNYDQFENLAGQTWQNADLEFISEHRGQDSSGFISGFYRNYEAVSKQRMDVIDGLTQSQIEDIIVRCRLLRALDQQKALRMIYSAFSAIQEVFSVFNPDYVLSVTIDSYIIHLISIVAEKRGVKFIGLVPTFINGYFRITTAGEKGANREVSMKEVSAISSQLRENQYKPSWLAGSESLINKKATRNWARNLVKPLWFRFYSALKRDPLNAHYLTTKIVSQRYWSIMPRNYSGVRELKQLVALCDLKDQLKVFLPLQMSPEATIDYWSSDTTWINYEEKVFNIVDNARENIIFLVKEHPNVLGFRSPGFYKNLLSRSNVIAIAPSFPSNDVLELSDAVVVCTGTVGFEGLLRKKPVITDSKPFYAPESQFLPMKMLFEQKCAFPSVFGGMNDFNLVEYLISGCFEGTFLNDGTWSRELEAHLSFNKRIAESLRGYLLDNDL